MGDVRLAAGITAGIAGDKRNFSAFVLDAEIPALLRKGGRLDFSRDTLTLGLRVHDMGQYILSAPEFHGRGGGRGRGHRFSATMAEWACSRKSPNLDNGGIRLPFAEDGMCSFTPLRVSLACKAISFGDARDGTLSDPEKIITKLHDNWGRTSDQQINRALMRSDGDKLHLRQHVDEVLGRCAPRTYR